MTMVPRQGAATSHSGPWWGAATQYRGHGRRNWPTELAKQATDGTCRAPSGPSCS